MTKYTNRFRKGEPQRLRYVLNHALNTGGHLSAQSNPRMGGGGLEDFVRIDPDTGLPALVHFPMREDNPYQIDVGKTKEVIADVKPDLIITGRSMVIEREPVMELRSFVDKESLPSIIYDDEAHTLGLEQRPGPHAYGSSTHKPYFVTHRGIIAADIPEGSELWALWKLIEQKAFPGSMSNHHLGTLLGLCGATFEWREYGLDYRAQVIANAKAFARALKEAGLVVEGDPAKDYTETHQVLLNVGERNGIEIAKRLEENNIIVNYQALPFDASFSTSSGIRMGVQEMTRFGMKEKDLGHLAELMADIILRNQNRKEEVTQYRRQFTGMQYCYSGERALRMRDQLLNVLGSR